MTDLHDIELVLERVVDEQKRHNELLMGDPKDRNDGGIVGDVREMRKTIASGIWWLRAAGGGAIAVAGTIIVKLLYG